MVRRGSRQAVAEAHQRGLDVLAPAELLGEFGRTAAPRQPGFGAEQCSEIAYLIAFPGVVGHREPFAIGALGGGLAGVPRPFLRRIVILGAPFPGVVGAFVIVPHHHHRRRGVKALKIGIRAIGGMAESIVGEGDRLRRRVEDSAGHGFARRRVFAAFIFVEIVAEMDEQIEVAAAGGMGVGVEMAEGEVGAGKDAEGEARGLAFGQGAGAARRRDGASAVAEAVMIGPAGLQAGGDRLHAMIVPGLGGDVAFGDDPSEIGGGRNLPVDPAAAAIAGPQHHRALARLAARDPVGEAALGGDAGHSGDCERAKAQRPGLEEKAAIEVEGHKEVVAGECDEINSLPRSPIVIPAEAGNHEHRRTKPRTIVFMDPGSSPG